MNYEERFWQFGKYVMGVTIGIILYLELEQIITLLTEIKYGL